MPHLRRSMVQAVYQVADAVWLNKALLRGTRNSLRILAYHAVCPDEVRGEPWIPPFFVALSEFEQQMSFLRARLRPVQLSDALEYARKHGRFEPGSVALTFDDGYANNVSLALPVLQHYHVPATIFLATRWIEEQELFPHDRARLLRLCGNGSGDLVSQFKTMPIGSFLDQLEKLYPASITKVSDVQRRNLKPLSWQEVEAASGGLLEFGAHTHQHAVLRNEISTDREREIATSLALVKKHTGAATPLFSYPNGERGDFSSEDKHILARCGCPGAVSGIAGWNQAGIDPFELKRFPVSLQHSTVSFRAEVSGLRSLVAG